jgi:PAS domain-containing protein
MRASRAPTVVAETARTAGLPVMPAGTAEDVAVLTLDELGMVRDCNRGGELLFRYHHGELVWRHISLLLPELADLQLMPDGEPNPRLRYFCRVGRHLQAVTHDGGGFACELYFNVLDNDPGHDRLVLVVRRTDEAVND